MTDSSLDRLTVLAAGVLGGQIGWHSAFKGKTVVISLPAEATGTGLVVTMFAV